MEFVTNEKLTIVGAAGMSLNMAQTAVPVMGPCSNICYTILTLRA